MMLLLNFLMVFNLKAMLNKSDRKIRNCSTLNGNSFRKVFHEISSHVEGRGSFFLFVKVEL